MKALILLALRVSTGALLLIWGSIKAFAPDIAIHVSDKYYAGTLSTDTLQAPLGYAQIALGAMVIAGLFRKITYPVQALVLVIGMLAIWKYILDPFGLYFLTEETRNVLFFPSTTVAIASLLLLVFKDDDLLALDHVLFKG